MRVPSELVLVNMPEIVVNVVRRTEDTPLVSVFLYTRGLTSGKGPELPSKQTLAEFDSLWPLQTFIDATRRSLCLNTPGLLTVSKQGERASLLTKIRWVRFLDGQPIIKYSFELHLDDVESYLA